MLSGSQPLALSAAKGKHRRGPCRPLAHLGCFALVPHDRFQLVFNRMPV